MFCNVESWRSHKKACIFSSALSILGDETFWSTRSLYEVKLIFPSAACSSVWSFRWPLDFRISHEIKMVCCCKPVSHYTHRATWIKRLFYPVAISQQTAEKHERPGGLYTGVRRHKEDHKDEDRHRSCSLLLIDFTDRNRQTQKEKLQWNATVSSSVFNNSYTEIWILLAELLLVISGTDDLENEE